jgi:hypothetical protein
MIQIVKYGAILYVYNNSGELAAMITPTLSASSVKSWLTFIKESKLSLLVNDFEMHFKIFLAGVVM